MGEPVSTSLLIGSLIMSGVTAFSQVRQASSQAHAQEEAAGKSLAFQQEELTRQQGEVDKGAREESAETIRRANHELGTLRVAGGATGASTGSFARMVAELGYVEGLDLSRIEDNRKSRTDALQAQKRVASQDFLNVTTTARNQKSAATTNATLGFIGSGLQLGASYNHRSEMRDLAKNRKTA